MTPAEMEYRLQEQAREIQRLQARLDLQSQLHASTAETLQSISTVLHQHHNELQQLSLLLAPCGGQA